MFDKIVNSKFAKTLHYEVSPRALELWNRTIEPAASSENTINLLGVVGDDWDGGLTSSSVARMLANMSGDVNVNINSPGGSLFEGLAIYSMLKEYPGNVNVNVLSLAASAASVIAMAGDSIKIQRAGFIMIHNAWIGIAGNRHELREAADFLEPVDAAMVDLYHAESGLDKEVIAAQLDAETWINSSTAIDSGFADDYLSSDAVSESANARSMNAVKNIDLALAKAGVSRSSRRSLMQDFKATLNAGNDGMRNAADNDMPRAVMIEAEPLQKLEFNLKFTD